MKQGDMEVIVKGLAPVMIELVRRAVQPVADRMAYLEARQAPQGEPGPPGKDGFALDDFDIRPCDDGRSIVLSFQQGEVRNEFELTFPVPIYRGVYKTDEEYVPGDSTTFGGSLWIAERKTTAKPDTPDSGWRLAVKRGRDGKDAKVG